MQMLEGKMPDDYTKTPSSPLETPETLYVRVTVEDFPPVPSQRQVVELLHRPFPGAVAKPLLCSRTIQ